MRTGQIAKALGVHPNTLRAWCDEFAEHVSAEARRANARRHYSRADITTLATIAEMRQAGASTDDIRKALKAGKRAELAPALLEAHNDGLVTKGELQSAVQRVQELRAELQEARKAAELAAHELALLQAELGIARGKLAMLEAMEARNAQLMRYALYLAAGAAVMAAAMAVLAVLAGRL